MIAYQEIAASESRLIELLLQGRNISGLYINSQSLADEINQANENYFGYPLTVEYLAEDFCEKELHQKNINKWLVPDKYMNIDVKQFLSDKISSRQEQERFDYEYNLFYQHNLINVLRLMIYLVDYFREHQILWGVGRGSSVASFVLYLIGINRINPMTYGLSADEFFK